ncbi:MAG: tetratricopeptide repeat protein, partial [Candidatus Latescibacterota bacterium]
EPDREPGSFGEPAAYIETFRPRLSHDWCELRGLRTARWKLIEGPGYELYDLSADPKETNNVKRKYASVLDSLALLMDEIAFACVRRGSHAAPALELSEEERAKLLSLGYITPTSVRNISNDTLAVMYFPEAERGAALGLPHPRARIAASLRLNTAMSHYRIAYAALQKDNMEEAKWNFEEAIKNKTKFPEAYIGLAEIARRGGRTQDTLDYLQKAWDTHPQEPAITSSLADAFAKLGHIDDALQIIDEAIAEGFADSVLLDMSATLHEQAGNAESGMTK